MLHHSSLKTATSQSLSSLPKVAVVKRFDGITKPLTFSDKWGVMGGGGEERAERRTVDCTEYQLTPFKNKLQTYSSNHHGICHQGQFL